MPLKEEVASNLEVVLEKERKYCRGKIVIEEARTLEAHFTADSLVSAATAQAERRTQEAQELADTAVRQVAARLEAERAQRAKEMEQARAEAEATRAEARRRVDAARAARDAARPVAGAHVRRAKEARDKAVADADEAALNAECLGQARIAEARRREEAADARASKQEEEAKARAAQFIQELENQAQRLEDEARQRSEAAQRSAADQVASCTARLRTWLAFAEAAKAATAKRVDTTVKQASKRIAKEHELTVVLQHRSLERLQELEDMQDDAAGSVARNCLEYERKQLVEMRLAGNEIAAFDGLQDLAGRLQDGSLWSSLPPAG